MVNPFSETAPYPQGDWVNEGATGPGSIFYDGFDDRVEYAVNRTAALDGVGRDLTLAGSLGIPISDTDWRLRMHLNWPEFNSFRNTGNLFENSNIFYITLSDSDQSVSAGTASQKHLGIRVVNFDGNNPTAAIRAAPFRGLIQGFVRDGTTQTFTAQFTPGGPPTSQTTTFTEIVRAGSNLIITIYTDATFTSQIEQKMITIPAGITGLKYLKFQNLNSLADKFALISGRLLFYEILSGTSFTPIMPIFPSGLAAKIYNDLGINGPSTGNEVFARIFDTPPDPESWVRIREKNMYGFLERSALIQRDIDLVTWDITTWSVV